MSKMNKVTKVSKTASYDGFSVYYEYMILPDIGLSVRLVQECIGSQTVTCPWRNYADVRRQEIRAQAFARAREDKLWINADEPKEIIGTYIEA